MLRDLYDKVMAPVVAALPEDTKTLILSPDADLNFLSFPTLLTEQDRFLCERFEIRHVSTGRDLVPTQARAQSNDEIVIFANPAYRSSPAQPAAEQPEGFAIVMRSMDRDALRCGLTAFKSLPGSATEANTLQKMAPQWKLHSRVYMGKEASEQALSQIRSPRILHLATHGFFLTEEQAKKTRKHLERLMTTDGNQSSTGPLINPMQRCGLAFAGANKTLDAWENEDSPSTDNDGILTANEASVLDLQGTWLVTLSACDTGKGETSSGEGVLGLRRAFIQAGTQNLLMTQWPVSDQHTADFMQKFYKEAIRSGDAPGALSTVQRDMLIQTGKSIEMSQVERLCHSTVRSAERTICYQLPEPKLKRNSTL